MPAIAARIAENQLAPAGIREQVIGNIAQEWRFVSPIDRQIQVLGEHDGLLPPGAAQNLDARNAQRPAVIRASQLQGRDAHQLAIGRVTCQQPQFRAQGRRVVLPPVPLPAPGHEQGIRAGTSQQFLPHRL